MFEALANHGLVTPTVFLELLIGLSPSAHTPPETGRLSRILDPAGSSDEDRTPTTENIFGFGSEVDRA